jgi:hypothetical protein
MIFLDTNVIFEAMQPEPHPAVRAWLNQQAAETLYVSSVTLAELLFGIDALPAGKRNLVLTRCRQASEKTCWRKRSTVWWGCSGTECFHSTPTRHGTTPSWPSQPSSPGADFQLPMATSPPLRHREALSSRHEKRQPATPQASL